MSSCMSDHKIRFCQTAWLRRSITPEHKDIEFKLRMGFGLMRGPQIPGKLDAIVHGYPVRCGEKPNIGTHKRDMLAAFCSIDLPYQVVPLQAVMALTGVNRCASPSCRGLLELWSCYQESCVLQTIPWQGSVAPANHQSDHTHSVQTFTANILWAMPQRYTAQQHSLQYQVGLPECGS